MMIRIFALCAMLVAVTPAAAEDVAVPNPEPATSPINDSVSPTLAPVSACNKSACKKAVQQASACDSGCQKRSAQQAMLQQKLAELNCLQTEIDELRRTTGTAQQILVKVQVLEVSRTKLRRMGMDIATFEGQKLATTTTKQVDSLLQDSGKTFGVINEGDSYLSFMDWLQENDIGKVLTCPQILTVSGRPASCNIGGEIPLPAMPGSKQPVQFREYGTHIDLLAIALGDNRVRLEMRAKISEVDDSRSIDVAGTRVPALLVRQCDAPVELAFGQTGVLSGLVQNRAISVKIGDRIEDQTEEIELLLMVTPEAVPAISRTARLDDSVETASGRLTE